MSVCDFCEVWTPQEDQAFNQRCQLGNALREENRKLFEQVMSGLDPKVLEAASLAKDPFEVVATVLIFNRQKVIRDLMKVN